MTSFRVGVSSQDITPPIGTPIGGNFRDDYASRGVHMPLLAQVMVFQQGSEAAAIVAADLLVVTDEMVRDIRAIVQSECGLPGFRVMIAATHTHSGPATMALTADARASDDTIQEINRRVARAVCDAYRSAQPAELTVAEFDEPRLVFNRRLRMKDGTTRMNWEPCAAAAIDQPFGPTDPRGLVIAVRHGERIAGMLVNYALHPAVLAGDNWDLSSDWTGYLREALSRYLGTAGPVLYVNGAQGNINHIDAWDPRQGRGVKEAQRIGYVLAAAVAVACRGMNPIEGPLAVSSETTTLPRRKVDGEAVALAQRRLDALGATSNAGQEDGMPPWFFDRELIEHARRQGRSVQAEVQTIRVGNVAFVGLPGEFFVEYGLRLKALSPAVHTAPVGLANGSVGYVPIPAAIEQGGYEGQTWRYNQLTASAGETVVQCALKQLERLFAE